MTRLAFYYHDLDGRGHATQFWKNFMAHIHTYKKTPDAVWGMAFVMLEEYNAYIIEENYIKFETEEDMLLFMLRWA